MKLKISRSMTINTGNFTSIKPAVEVSVDVAAGNTEVAYEHLSKVADALMVHEILTLSAEMQSINDIGWGRYGDLMKHNVDEINKVLGENVDELIRYEK